MYADTNVLMTLWTVIAPAAAILLSLIIFCAKKPQVNETNTTLKKSSAENKSTERSTENEVDEDLLSKEYVPSVQQNAAPGGKPKVNETKIDEVQNNANATTIGNVNNTTTLLTTKLFEPDGGANDLNKSTLLLTPITNYDDEPVAGNKPSKMRHPGAKKSAEDHKKPPEAGLHILPTQTAALPPGAVPIVGTNPNPIVGTNPDPIVGTNPNPIVGTNPNPIVGTAPNKIGLRTYGTPAALPDECVVQIPYAGRTTTVIRMAGTGLVTQVDSPRGDTMPLATDPSHTGISQASALPSPNPGALLPMGKTQTDRGQNANNPGKNATTFGQNATGAEQPEATQLVAIVTVDPTRQKQPPLASKLAETQLFEVGANDAKNVIQEPA